MSLSLSALAALTPGIPLIESPLFEDALKTAALDQETSRIAADLHRHGYAVIRFPDDQIEARADRIKRALHDRFDFEGWRAAGCRVGMRIQDGWEFNDDVRAIASNAKILELLSKLYGRRAWPFQTLNFPVGTQQHFHSDSVHFSSIPERFMCGVWVALEDVAEGAGPLEYYPGTHRWPILYNEQIGIRVGRSSRSFSQEAYHNVWEMMVRKANINPKLFYARKGDALIWAANLLHGGSRQSDPNLTRWSQVTHYFFDDCCYFTPMFSDVPIGNLRLRSLRDISSGKIMPNIYVGANLSGAGLKHRMRTIRAVSEQTLRSVVQKFVKR